MGRSDENDLLPSSPAASPPVVSVSNKRVCGGSFDIASRLSVKTKLGIEKINWFLSMETELIGENESNYCEKLRSFNTTSLKPVLQCYRNCFNSNGERFVAKHGSGKWKHAKFNKICNGSCGSTGSGVVDMIIGEE